MQTYGRRVRADLRTDIRREETVAQLPQVRRGPSRSQKQGRSWRRGLAGESNQCFAQPRAMARIERETIGDLAPRIEDEEQVGVFDDAGPGVFHAGESEVRERLVHPRRRPVEITELRILEPVALGQAQHEIRAVLLRVE